MSAGGKVNLLICAMISSVSGFPFGAPYQTCIDLTPHHRTNQQDSPCPYTLTASQNEYSPSDNITISLHSPPGESFKGFQVVVQRVLGDREQVLGSFATFPKQITQAYPWYSSTSNCATHNSNKPKTSLELQWIAPPVSEGDLRIKATFVRDFEHFWVNVTYVLRAKQPVPPVYPEWHAQPAETVNTNLDKECGSTKGCMLWPKLCTGNDCDYVVTFKKSGGFVDFEVMGKTPGYLSLAFSDDVKMGKDETMTCSIDDGNFFQLQKGYNPRRYNERIRTTDFTNVKMTQYENNEKLYCTFRRPIKHVLEMHFQQLSPGKFGSVNRTFDLSDKFYMFLGSGPCYTASESIDHHVELPVVSPNKVDVLSTQVIHANAIPIPVQAHGSLMFIAWMFLASFGMVISRHYKDMLHTEWCGIKAWFQVHRAVMLLAAACSTAGFILIFVHVYKWRDAATLHAAFGIAVMAVTLLQIIVALCRPGPGASKRPIFNWFHRISGFLTHICAAVAMILGANVSLMPLRMQTNQTILIATWIAVHVLFLAFFEFIKCRRYFKVEKSYELDSYETKGESKGDSQNARTRENTSSGSSCLMAVALVFYAITMLAFLASALAFIFIY